MYYFITAHVLYLVRNEVSLESLPYELLELVLDFIKHTSYPFTFSSFESLAAISNINSPSYIFHKKLFTYPCLNLA